jgi:glutamate transport system substrate-binding protein
MYDFSRRGLLYVAAGSTAAVALAACSSGAPPTSTSTSSASGSASANRQISQDAYDTVIKGGPVADGSVVSASSWATKIKSQGYLKSGGTTTGAIFSLKDPTTGRIAGFDIGIADLLAHYITGGTDVSKLTQISQTSVDTRETMLQNNTVDIVVATYSITTARAQKIAFAGPYYSSGDSIQVKSDNTTIKSVTDLAGKKLVTESNSTAITALQKFVPGNTPTLFADNDSCVAAVQQGRADAYVLDESILLGNAVKNTDLKVVGTPFTTDPYGVGVNKDDPAVKAFVNAFLQKIIDSGDWLKLWKATVGVYVEAAPTAPKIGSVPGS